MTQKPTPCIFCDVSADNGFKIAYEDESFLAFESIKPASAVHYLVVPRRHIASIRTLNPVLEDIQLVKTMERIGHVVLDKFSIPPDNRRMGFHIPPFNSVDHLHLHVQGLPYKSPRGALSYFVTPGFAGYYKGFSWFVEVNQATRILERGRRVGVRPG